MSENRKLRIGTRGSPLALAQTQSVINTIKTTLPKKAEANSLQTVVIKTSGDRLTNNLLSDVGGKGLFTKELDEALTNNEIDLAIHSMKDIPTYLPENINLYAIMEREDPRDVLITIDNYGLDDLAEASIIATSSLRRKSQLLNKNPKFKVVPLRGNIDTRLQKLESKDFEATILAYAGLSRLKKEQLLSHVLDTETMLPAVGQGILAATCRKSDMGINELLDLLVEPTVAAAAAAEREMLGVLGGSCRTPIAGLAVPDGKGNLELTGLVGSPDGQKACKKIKFGTIDNPRDLGRSVGEEILSAGGAEILRLFNQQRPIFIPPHPEGDND